MLQVKQVAKAFSGFQAIARANLTVTKGQVTAVIGPNGAGKSTLFNLITGHLRPDKGQILFKGEEIGGLPPHAICRKGVARSFQLINIFPQLNTFENVQVAVLARYRQSNKLFTPARKLVVEETNEVLNKLDLYPYRERLCNALSYGDQKVLELAIALGNQPEILLLDEPTAGMSPEETRTIVKLIKNLVQNEGLTILLTEHDMDLVFDVAERLMVLHQGQTIAEGPPDEVRRDKAVQNAYLGETG
ncbi:ABC transporter ATP-binding protein [Paradesulfitobacterium ferrireducens]|uniref:ABC transporter ATP-binding protein n=1 Tax=Paradesulfitobacterium ferrireducens TaxID=2816476 RepID=UPI001A8DB25F|nr:ABC transporter ATP-binding protein [Paradesulfitobacterium ferrireducens]